MSISSGIAREIREYERMSTTVGNAYESLTRYDDKLQPQPLLAESWDLTNDAGDKIASGLYIYLIITDLGLKRTGQIAVIR